MVQEPPVGVFGVDGGASAAGVVWNRALFYEG